MPAHTAPGERRQHDREHDVRGAEHAGATTSPTHTETIAPMVHWPWPPMLNRPQRKAKATASDGEDQRRREEQRLLEVEGRVLAVRAGHPREEPVEPGAVEDALVDGERVVAGRRDHHAADQERQDRGDERGEEPASRQPDRDAEAAGVLLDRSRGRLGGGQRRGGGAHLRRPRCRASPRRAPRGRRPARTRPRSGPRRSRGSGPTSDRTSSSSSETSRIARPSSRSASRRRWTYSMAPTSRPRVGWEATSTAGSREISRAMITFCWLPPESELRVRLGVRRRARRTRPAGARRPPRSGAGTSTRAATRAACRSRGGRCSRRG